MSEQTLLMDRLAVLPPKVATPFVRLLETEQLSETSLASILDAGELSGETQKLLGFAVGYHHLKMSGVQVEDVIAMAKAQKRRVRLDWSAKRWKAEHNRLSRAATLEKLSECNALYDLTTYEAHLPKRFPGYLIRSSRRLGMEGLRQQHCIASYHDQILAGYTAIAAVFVDGRRWTVQLHTNHNPDRPLRISQIKSRRNQVADASVRRSVHDLLGIEIPQAPQRDVSASTTQRLLHLENLQVVLPVLREHGVSQVDVNFDGSGDSGCVDGATYEPRDFDGSAVMVRTRSYSRFHRDDQWVTELEEREVTMDDAVASIVDDYLSETNVDWYNNDGGYGEFKIDVDVGSVFLEVNTRYTNSDTAFMAELDIATGEELDV